MENNINTRSIGTRLSLNLAIIGAIALVAIGLFLSQTISANFSALERDEVESHILRTQAFLDDAKSDLDSKVKDWAFWDESYDYVADFNAQYEIDNINLEAMQNYAVDGLAVVRYDGLQSRSFFFDYEQGTDDRKKAVELERFATSAGVISRVKHTKSFQFYKVLDGKLAVVAVAQITRSDNSGTPKGFMVFARKFDQSALDEALQLKSRVLLQPAKSDLSVVTHDSHIDVVKGISGDQGASIAAITFPVERAMMQRGWQMLWLALACVVAMLVAMVAVMRWRIGKIVLAPLDAFGKQVDHIRESGDLVQIQDIHADDEIGKLQQNFNAMTRELEALRTQNEAQSFALGKSQSAIGVMHNVRNGLSPMNVFLSRLDADLALPALAHVRQALAELDDPQTSEDRRSKMTAFLKAFVEQVENSNQSQRRIVGNAKHTIETVLEAIDQVQRVDSGQALSIENCDAEMLVRQTADLLGLEGDRRQVFEILVHQSPPLSVNRVLLVQILGNLLKNASESIASSAVAKGRIRVTIESTPDARMCEISISDNGEGFDPELATKLFERGYSTRSNKAGGLGLHWCANSINAMGGSLTIESEGSGQGATARLLLPIARQEDEAVSSPSVAQAA